MDFRVIENGMKRITNSYGNGHNGVDLRFNVFIGAEDAEARFFGRAGDFGANANVFANAGDVSRFFFNQSPKRIIGPLLPADR